MALVHEPDHIYVIEITRDITERRNATQALSRSEQQYRLLFDHSPLPMWVFDRETLKFMAVNEAAICHYGFSREEFLLMTIADIGEIEEMPELMRALVRPVKGRNHRGMWRHRIKNNAIIKAEITSHAISFGGRAAELVSAEDITERQLKEDASQASELRYRRLFESAQDGILILDAETGKILDANPYIMNILGYSHEDLIGKELWEIGFFQDVNEAKKTFEELKIAGYVRYEDLPLKTHTGLVIEVEVVSNVYPVGEAKVIQCNIRDITERRRGERALEESNRKLEATLAELSATTQQLWQASKLATMGELSASIAHELNNPLATVALRVENLLMPMGADDNKRHSLEVITQEVDRMAALVNNLLQFSRRSHRQVATADLREEIEKSIEFVNYHLRTHKIEIVSDFAEPLPTIQADHLQLRQLFLNLLTNASDAMPQGGTLTVRATTGVLHEAEAVYLDFTDTGEGIPLENLKKIWDPFFTTKMEGKGTGLGLAICRRIVEEHGGTIDLKSEPGCGTTVHIVFPATMDGPALQKIS
jgi:PAS domain S-box-containing protein